MKNAHKNNCSYDNVLVSKLDVNGNFIEEYESIRLAARDNNLSKHLIIWCCKNIHKNKTGGGYLWARKEKQGIRFESDEVFKKIDKIGNLVFDNYEISSYGKLRNIRTQKILAPATSNGYARFQLYMQDGKPKQMLSHRLVAYFFIKRVDDDTMVVNHLDENKLNNHVSNLEWCTQLKNKIHSVGKKVCKIDKDTGCILYTYDSVASAGKKIGNPGAFGKISKCCNSNQITSYGFAWKFLKDIIDEMLNDGYIEITTKELNETQEGTFVSFIGDNGQLRYSRKLTDIESNVMTYMKDDKRFYYRLSNIKKVWIKQC
uniref:HNH nuclease domain-containing protein n=1 Tax=viral metagenome TaxID=1070528 RepID=A0A6C0C628_9ZZZZ